MIQFLKNLFGFGDAHAPKPEPPSVEEQIKEQIESTPVVEEPVAPPPPSEEELAREQIRLANEKHDREREERLRRENMR